MKNLSCSIVDDEPLAQELIEKYINRLPYLTLKAKYSNAIDALDGISDSKVDIIFLDINMPEMTGIEFLNSLTGNRPYIILTSASPQYAMDGFEHDVVDYLLKPIAFSRFMRAINKIKDRIQPQADAEKEITIQPPSTPPLEAQANIIENEGHHEKFFLIKVDKKLLKINIEEIVFVEGMKDYVKIHMQNNFIITHITMTKISNLLPSALFIRINRSYIIQIKHIKSIEGNMIETSNGKKLTIGFNYREIIRETAKGWTIKH